MDNTEKGYAIGVVLLLCAILVLLLSVSHEYRELKADISASYSGIVSTINNYGNSILEKLGLIEAKEPIVQQVFETKTSSPISTRNKCANVELNRNSLTGWCDTECYGTKVCFNGG